MTRKILIIFALTGAISYLILLSWAGEGGYLHNQALKAESERLKYAEDVLALEVESLSARQRQGLTSDAIKDAAFKYGYLEEGEEVFYFDLPPEEVPVPRPRYTAKRPSFEGLARWKIAAIAASIAALVSAVAVAVTKRRR